MKYVLVTGGVISGVGKGLISSSLGLLLKSKGFGVTMVKIDPYINIDAGTFSPYEHGEVFVLDDGSEVDLDLGNYERFLDIRLAKEHNITTGRVYQNVIRKEREGAYLGKTVQVIPHITDEIQDLIEKAAHLSGETDICVVELGGTVGDIESMPFVEALRQFQFRKCSENFCNIHVSLVPYLRTSHESKSKPTQESVRTLRKLGLQPFIIVCRSEVNLATDLIEKIAMFSDVTKERVVSMVDQRCVFNVPLALEQSNLATIVLGRLGLSNHSSVPNDCLAKWRDFTDRAMRAVSVVNVAIVGKYASYPDSYTSVVKALEHAAILCRRNLHLSLINSSKLEDPSSVEWAVLRKAHGLVVPGGFGHRGIRGKIAAIEWARRENVPFLGICLGMQCAVIEFCQNVLGMDGAGSEEFVEIEKPNATHVIIEMPEHNPVDAKGGTMRLGLKRTVFRKDIHSDVKELYKNHDYIEERHRHRFEVNKQYLQVMEEKGLVFTGTSEDKERMEVMELRGHKYFVGVQFHPEYLSRMLRPSPVYIGLIASACQVNLSKLKFTYSCNSFIDKLNRQCDHCTLAENETADADFSEPSNQVNHAAY